MRIRRVLVTLLVSAGLAALLAAGAAGADVATAQAPARGAAAAQPARGAAAPARGGSSAQVHGTLAQIMRAIRFPTRTSSSTCRTTIPPRRSPTPTGPYLGTYQGWEGVENASLAIAEFANLILIPGRMCSNGKPVPLNQPDFVKFAQALRATGLGRIQRRQDQERGRGEQAQRPAHRHVRELPRQIPAGQPHRRREGGSGKTLHSGSVTR